MLGWKKLRLRFCNRSPKLLASNTLLKSLKQGTGVFTSAASHHRFVHLYEVETKSGGPEDQGKKVVEVLMRRVSFSTRDIGRRRYGWIE